MHSNFLLETSSPHQVLLERYKYNTTDQHHQGKVLISANHQVPLITNWQYVWVKYDDATLNLCILLGFKYRIV